MIKKIAILTSGGDAPGMNNAIITVTQSALSKGIEVFFVKNGYRGLFNDEIISSTETDYESYNATGGTFIYSARFPEFKEEEFRIKAKENLDKRDIHALVVIGGDGSYKGAQALHELGVNTIALPGTIDNDIPSSEYTIGYDTALNTIVDSIDRLRNTSNSHNRVSIVEVMGRNCGDLALYSGMATSSEIVITIDHKLSAEEIIMEVKGFAKEKRQSVSIIIAEHIFDDIQKLAKQVEVETGMVTRATILGYIQRGGRPTARDRNIAWRLGNYAVELLAEGQSGVAVGIVQGRVHKLPIMEALSVKSPNRKILIEKVNKLSSTFK